MDPGLLLTVVLDVSPGDPDWIALVAAGLVGIREGALSGEYADSLRMDVQELGYLLYGHVRFTAGGFGRHAGKLPRAAVSRLAVRLGRNDQGV